MSNEAQVGKTLNERYELRAELGGGGMGAVYKGYDPTLKREVAIKVMHPQYARQSTFQARFLQEAAALGQLNHPGIVQVYDAGRDRSGQLFIVMEFIRGDNLRQMLNRMWQEGKWIPLAQTLQIMQRVCWAIDYAHQQGVLHRDIKPANIMMRSDPSGKLSVQPVLTDLGLAKLAEGGVETQTGVSMGTPAYMSPEQALGKETDAHSDVYSLGVLLYELCVGRLPFPINSLTEAVRYYARETLPPVPSPRLVNPNLPEMVEKAILKALKPTPADRFASAAKLAEALDYVEARVPGDTVPPAATTGPEDIGLTYQASVINQPPDLPSSLPSLPPVALDHLVIIAPDKSRRVVELKERSLTIGRDEGNNLVLPAEKMSRHHARIEFEGGEYRVTDLKSRNGSFLNQVYLLPGVPTSWPPDQWLYVGGYWLLLRKGISTSPEPVVPRDTPSLIGGTRPTETSQLEARFEPAQVRLTPGTPGNVTLIITNPRAEAERLTLSLSGDIPKECLPSLPAQLMVPVRVPHSLQLAFQPPRTAQVQAGTYQLQVRVVSQHDSAIEARATCQVTIVPFSAFSSEVQPERLRPKQAATVTIHNEGNTSETFSIKWKDQGDDLLFDAPRRQLSLKPGGKGQLKFTVTPARPRLVGDEARHKFDTEVSREGGESQSHQGVLVSRGVIPAWLPKVATVLLSVVVLGIMGWWLSTPRISGFTVEPSQVAAGESARIKVDSFSLLGSTITMNGTPAPGGELAYQIAPGVTGAQVINIELADFLGREATEVASIVVAVPLAVLTPTPGILATIPPAPSADGDGSAGTGTSNEPVADGAEESGDGGLSGTKPVEEPSDSSEPAPPGSDSTTQITDTTTITVPLVTATVITSISPISTSTPTLTPTSTATPTILPTPTDTPTLTPTPVVILIAPLASSARWASGQLTDPGGDWRDVQALAWMGNDGDDKGFVRLDTVRLEDGSTQQALRTHPKWVPDGSIKGWHPWVKIPKNAIFEAQVGFVGGATGTDGVLFVVYEHHSENGRETWSRIAELRKGYTGSLQTIRADLSRFADQEVGIELRVDAGSSSGQDWAVWVNPMIKENR